MRPVLFFALVAAIGFIPARIARQMATSTAQAAAPTAVQGEHAGTMNPSEAAPAAPVLRQEPPIKLPTSEAGAAAARSNEPAAASALTQWFHPRGHRCPAWEFSTAASAASQEARVGCQRYSLRWLNGAVCVPKRGPSIPSC